MPSGVDFKAAGGFVVCYCVMIPYKFKVLTLATCDVTGQYLVLITAEYNADYSKNQYNENLCCRKIQ